MGAGDLPGDFGFGAPSAQPPVSANQQQVLHAMYKPNLAWLGLLCSAWHTCQLCAVIVRRPAEARRGLHISGVVRPSGFECCGSAGGGGGFILLRMSISISISISLCACCK